MGSHRRKSTAPTDFPDAMTFRPTLEEFKDFPGYVRKIEAAGAHEAGICKIVCPDGWVPRKAGYDVDGFPFRIQRPVEQTMTPMAEEKGFRGVFQVRVP